ncbi:MAG: 6,7-dimethyl-8-ribityllumazine synthase [Alphaproteobacteria bacterium CG11_big_fil_rev_8_21_14_0_20_44_7]|nr:MAG: 6,7-dimethyl-8-ribityllumazine synthase [Alphaproteobacteria bacterium CG11_big_fil_rev_8_21_14_0_20_44_7]
MKILLIEARFYPEIADLQLDGAKNRLQEENIAYDVISLAGALEIPPAISMLRGKYDGFVALGCVIRGETYHFEIVANESARGIMDLGLEGLAIGNAILTVENKAQALERAEEKGKHAVEACLQLVDIKNG